MQNRQNKDDASPKSKTEKPKKPRVRSRRVLVRFLIDPFSSGEEGNDGRGDNDEKSDETSETCSGEFRRNARSKNFLLLSEHGRRRRHRRSLLFTRRSNEKGQQSERTNVVDPLDFSRSGSNASRIGVEEELHYLGRRRF